MRYCIVCLLLVIVSFGRVNAQENRNGFRLDTIYKSGAKRQVVKAPVKKSVPLKSSVSRKVGKWTLSGSCGMSFGDYTSIDVSPQIGYRWNEFFSAGGGVRYNYHHSSNRYDMNYLGTIYCSSNSTGIKGELGKVVWKEDRLPLCSHDTGRRGWSYSHRNRLYFRDVLL